MHEAEHPETGIHRLHVGWLCLSCSCLAFTCLWCRNVAAQNGGPATGGALVVSKAMEATPINQPPDAIAQLRLRKQRFDQRTFDAANALRQRQIADESAKLLLLARDLKSEMDLTGNDALPAKLLREIEVIEMLARDVRAKMTLTIGMD